MNVAMPAAEYSFQREATSAAVLDRFAYIGLCAFLFSVPWEESRQLAGFPFSRALGIATLGIALLRLAVSWKSRKLSGLHYLMMSLVGLSALSLFWTVDWDSTVQRIGTYSQLL